MNKIFVDQIGCKVSLDAFPQRIVSLVPSQTELLFDLGLGEKIVAVTKFCIHPKEFTSRIQKIGGTKDFSVEKIFQLKPDLIVANKEENPKEGIETLRAKVSVWTSDVSTVGQALDMIDKVAEVCAVDGSWLIQKITDSFNALDGSVRAKALYLIWRKPFMAAGRDTFISSMMQKAGFENLCKHDRYPQISPQQMQELNPEYILLSSEPYPFKEKNITEIRQICPQSKVQLVDGEMFSWYGSRMLKAAQYFKTLWQ